MPSRRKSKSRISRNSGKKIKYITRKSYVRLSRSGKKIRVPSTKVIATSGTGEKTIGQNFKYLKKRASLQRVARKQLGKKGSIKCPKGMVPKEPTIRRSYTRKSYSRRSRSGSLIKVKARKISRSIVKPSCVKSPNVTKKRQLFRIVKGTLGRFGYDNVNTLNESERHTALRKAMKDMYNPLAVYRKLRAVWLVNRRTNPTVAKIFEKDAEWVKSTKEYQNRPSSRKVSRKSR